MGLWQQIKNNHLVLMMVTCILPFAVLAILMFGFGIQSKWFTFIALGVCLGSHLWMMKSMHQQKEGGSCH
ncbi:hypothetical protein HYW21_02460 [Candidatus Woesearchaeota archaeon]|nr:hypothetical protein [Candidatus Woesearchaeota archaeon]